MNENKIAKSTSRDALRHLRANRVLLARRVNGIALKIIDLRAELETLDEEMKAKAHQLEQFDRGIRTLGADNLSARRTGRLADSRELAGRRDG